MGRVKNEFKNASVKSEQVKLWSSHSFFRKFYVCAFNYLLKVREDKFVTNDIQKNGKSPSK